MSSAARTSIAAATCVAALVGPRLLRAQCAPKPRARDPLTQAVAGLHAPKAAIAPRPHVAHATRPHHAPKRPLVQFVARVVPSPSGQLAAAPRARPVVKHRPVHAARVARPTACRPDSTLGLPPLPIVTESFGAVPDSPFTVGMIASAEQPPMAAVRPLRPLWPHTVPNGGLPGSAGGLTIAVGAAGGLAWQHFWRSPGNPTGWSPIAPPPDAPPVVPPAAYVPDQPLDPAGGEVPPSTDPSVPRDTVSHGGGGAPAGGGGPSGGPALEPREPGDPLLPDPIPGLPFPTIPTTDPHGPPNGPPNGPPYGPPNGPPNEPPGREPPFDAPSPVPEPATGALIAVGTIAMGAALSRRKRRE